MYPNRDGNLFLILKIKSIDLLLYLIKRFNKSLFVLISVCNKKSNRIFYSSERIGILENVNLRRFCSLVPTIFRGQPLYIFNFSFPLSSMNISFLHQCQSPSDYKTCAVNDNSENEINYSTHIVEVDNSITISG